MESLESIMQITSPYISEKEIAENKRRARVAQSMNQDSSICSNNIDKLGRNLDVLEHRSIDATESVCRKIFKTKINKLESEIKQIEIERTTSKSGKADKMEALCENIKAVYISYQKSEITDHSARKQIRQYVNKELKQLLKDYRSDAKLDQQMEYSRLTKSIKVASLTFKPKQVSKLKKQLKNLEAKKIDTQTHKEKIVRALRDNCGYIFFKLFKEDAGNKAPPKHELPYMMR